MNDNSATQTDPYAALDERARAAEVERSEQHPPAWRPHKFDDQPRRIEGPVTRTNTVTVESGEDRLVLTVRARDSRHWSVWKMGKTLIDELDREQPEVGDFVRIELKEVIPVRGKDMPVYRVAAVRGATVNSANAGPAGGDDDSPF